MEDKLIEEDVMVSKEFAGWIVAAIMFLSLSIMAIYARSLGDRLEKLERESAEQQTMQETRMDELNIQVEAIQEEMNYGFEEQQKQIDAQLEQIGNIKNVQSNTNRAFTRYQNQQSKVEQELREELKKD